MKREVALERLRAGGRLSATEQPLNVLTETQASMPLARTVKHLIENHVRSNGPRCLAPSPNHAVLP